MTASPAPSAAPTAPPKKIVVCLDGTGNQIGGSRGTNVAKMFEMLELTHPGQQIAYYDPGVGTLPSPTARGYVGRTVSQVSQLAFGAGLKANVAQAYTWLMQHYQPQDEVYVFGFSRGAYTARALLGMLARPGLLRPGSENLVDYAIKLYAVNEKLTTKQREALRDFSDAFCWGTEKAPLFPAWSDAAYHEQRHCVPIAYLGVWDTVNATGFLRKVHWPFTHELPNVATIRHAVSIDERRKPYHEFLVDQRAGVEELWFPGVHSDVGGTFFDGKDVRVLSTISLKWVADGVRDSLLFRDGSYAAACQLVEDQYRGKIHPSGGWWRLVGSRTRPIPAGGRLHETVKLRRQWDSSYLPGLPADAQYDDPGWVEPAS